MKILLITFLSFFIGCKQNDNVENKDNLMKIKKLTASDSIKNYNIVNNDFDEFTNKFQVKDLPFKIQYNKENWFDFLQKPDMSEINQNDVIKYLLNGDKSKLIQTDGGIKQFYFGYKIFFPNKNIGLIYYMTDISFVGFNMSLFNDKGAYLGNLFLSGAKGEYDIEGQKDVFFDKEGNIKIIELELINSENLAQKKEFKFDSNLKKVSSIVIDNIEIVIDNNINRINEL